MHSIETRDAEPTTVNAAKADGPNSILTPNPLEHDVSHGGSAAGKASGFSSVDTKPESAAKASTEPSQEADDVWAAAIKAISAKDLQCLSQANSEHLSHRQIVSGILEAAIEKKRDCSKKRWKVKIDGRNIFLRDVLEKMTVWINKVIRIGDIAVQYDPVSAALPWAAVRLLMQASVNDVEVFGYVLHSIELITHIMASCAILELIYCQPSQSKYRLKVSGHFTKSLTTLYASILHHLARIIGYFDQNSVIRFVRSTVFSKTDMEECYAVIERAKGDVWSLMNIAEAEKSASILAGVELLNSRESVLSQESAKLQNLIEELRQPVNRISDEIEAIRDDLNTDKRSKILMAISSIPSRSHHKAARKGRLQGSGKWLLEKPAFVDWRQQSVSSVMWLHGIPGSGKTKLTSLIVDELESSENMAFFYCMRNPAEPQRGQADKILASLVRQLAATRSNSTLLPPIIEKYKEALSGFADFEDQEWTSDESFSVLLKLMNIYPSITLVLDALDEVNQEDRQELLDLLSRLLQESPNLVKVFISSRDNYDISLHLSGSPNVYIEASDNAGDIGDFIQSELQSARLLNGRLSDDLRALISNKLSEDAHGIINGINSIRFRWVALQIQFLRPLKVAADIEARLGVLPATLEESYWEIYQQIQSSGEYAARLATFTFRWLLFAKKAMRPDGIAAIATTYFSKGGSTHIYDGVNVLDVCANLVTERGNMVVMAHLSVREFFESISKRGVDDFCSEISNACLAEACVYHLIQSTRTLEKDVRANNLEELTKKIHVERGDMDYSSRNWHNHVLLSEDHRQAPEPRRIMQSFIFEDGHFTKMFNTWCVIAQICAEAESRSSYIDRYNLARVASLYITSKRLGHNDGLNILTIIIEHMDSSVNLTAATQEALLWGAATNQATHLVKLLLDYKLGLTGLSKALYLATSNGDIETRDILLQHGAKNDENAAVVRALILGAPQTAINLIDANYDIEGRYLDKARTALHYAVEKGFTTVVKCLLEKGVAVNTYDRDRKTPLHIAAGKGETECVKLLLGHGADFLLEDRDGRIALDLAEIRNHQSTAALIRTAMQRLMEKLQEGKNSRRNNSAKD